MEKRRGRGFLVNQRGFLKLYLLTMIEEKKHRYAHEMYKELDDELKLFGYRPTRSEVYKTLHEMTREEYFYRQTRIKGDPAVDFQEIITYELSEKGKEAAKLFKKQMKTELDHCIRLLRKAVDDNY